MTKLNRLHFLIHGFCHAEMAARGQSDAGKPNPYLARENRCAAEWRARIRGFAETEALIVMTWPHGPAGPAADYEALATDVLGDRCFVLDCPYGSEQRFWEERDAEFRDAILTEMRSLLTGQWEGWNKEELSTALLSVACCQGLRKMLSERDCQLDGDGLSADAWGASFEGCVTKYSLHFRRLLGLAQPIDIRFDLTVPDALFLVDAKPAETVPLRDGLRLFLFHSAEGTIALYAATSLSPADKPACVGIPIDPATVTVRSKQGIRLWPDPEDYHLPSAGIGLYEPPQKVVAVKDGMLCVPVTVGLVYRLAKAPAYIFSPQDMPYDRFRDALVRAEHAAS
jgi:hypothetical protein